SQPLAKRGRVPTFQAMSDTDRLLENETRVRDGFWRKARQTLGKVPFTEDAVAAFHCALDPATPLPIRATLFGALGYFVMPFDAIPDFIFGLGYTDDAAILIAAFTAARVHISEAHREKARAWLLKAQASPAA
ncbi:MAG TPA: YkvA family protein, partial [Reyranella sp.]